MSTLTNNTADALQEIKAAIIEKIGFVDNSGKVWERIRYADNLNEWLAMSAVEPVAGVDALRVIFVYLSGFTTERAEFRQRRITATYAIEVIQGFVDGTDEDNSTLIYERLLGDLEDIFSKDDSLGFTDPASQSVENAGFNANPGENEGKPVYIDGVLGHRCTGTLEVYFRMC